MPNFLDDSHPRSSNKHGAVVRARAENPVFCEHVYDEVDDEGYEQVCANKAIRHTDPPRCARHGGVHPEWGRKRTDAGFVKVNPRVAAMVENPALIEELDDEELARGQLRNKNGKFGGAGTAMVPRGMYAKMTQELFKRADAKMKTNLVDAVEVLMGIATSPNSDPKDAMKAAMWIVERVMGKAADTVVVKQDAPWQQMLVRLTTADPKAYEDFVKENATNADDERF